jgi:hypothetical protein
MTEHLHADDVPLSLAVLRALVGHRADREQLGYRPDEWGADVDWNLLATGKLSTTEKATVHIAQGCAIIERHGAAYRTASADRFEPPSTGSPTGDGLVDPRAARPPTG